jgi:amyloid beta precursor protein binding protein 1
MDSKEHSHTPFIAILIQHINKWKLEHNGNLPESRIDKELFKSIILKSSKGQNEENFNEAYKSAHKAYIKSQIPSGINSVINDKKAIDINSKSDKFWIVSHAIRDFILNEGNGTLPIMGNIPDMTSSTIGYIDLQKIYQQKSNDHFLIIQSKVKLILTKFGFPENYISSDYIKKYCKNSMFIQVIRFRSLEEEYNFPNNSLLLSELTDQSSNLIFYIMNRAVDIFIDNYKRFPGNSDHEINNDFIQLKNITYQLIHQINSELKIEDKYIQEM